MDSDEEDFVFYGTPIEREEEITSRKKKSVAEASGNLRALPSWKQEVRDEEGRRRFHGAFTGGYSAGYYNTVGSKEGWTPQPFTSSRKNRAEIKQQNIFSFLDDDEKEELEGRSLGTSVQFDTFGFTAAELARKQAEKEQQQRPSIIPGPAPDELVIPATISIGVKLLLKMGWRHGRAIKDSRTNSLYDARREARKAFLALSSDDTVAQVTCSEPVAGDIQNALELPTDNDKQFPRSTPHEKDLSTSYGSVAFDRYQLIHFPELIDETEENWASKPEVLEVFDPDEPRMVYVLNPKQDLHGLGFDPFKHAPEFRDKSRSRLHGNKEMGQRKPFSVNDSLSALRSGRVAPGFGIGALEELDTEDEDVYASGYDFEETYVEEIEEPSKPSTDNKKKLTGKGHGVLPGFKVASNSDYQLERFDPPIIPKDFVPRHTFPAPLDIDNKLFVAPPPEIPPPEDNNLKILIEGVATIVARCGKLFEDLSREKNLSNPLFSFLNGGNGHDYYSRKLWEEQQKRNDQTKQQLDGKVFLSVQKMTAESRGKILGEKPLESSSKNKDSDASADIHLQFNLSDTFTKPASLSEIPDVTKPFREDPAKQARFEQFLKDKYRGGLRSKDSCGASNMSEAARAREKLEFEAAAEAIGKGKCGKESSFSNQQFTEIHATTGLQFTSGGLEQVSQAEEFKKKLYPKREEFQWRPSPILCKRFDIMDPYMGKPPPPPRVRSKIESLIFMPDSVKPAKMEETSVAYRKSSSVPQSGVEEINKEEADREPEVGVEVENVERPVDLYKAIFSDDSDAEEENSSLNQVEDPKKKVEAASTTLNRLIAGDFLESLGKELGLEVPPDLPSLENRTSEKETVNNANKENVNKAVLVEKMPSSGLGTYINEELESKAHQRNDNVVVVASRDTDLTAGHVMERLSSENKSGKVELGKVDEMGRNAETPTDRQRKWSTGSSEDERSRKRSRHHRHSSSVSDSDATDSSDDYRDRHHSRSKGRKKGSSSSREKSSSRKHSKHRKHGRRGDSLSMSHRVSEKERESKREKQR